MCNKKIQIIGFLTLLLSVVFAVDCMEDNGKAPQQRSGVLTRRNSKGDDLQIRRFSKPVFDTEASARQLLSNKIQELESLNKKYTLEQDRLKKENDQLEKNMIFTMNMVRDMVQDEEFKNAIWRQGVGAFFKEQQRLFAIEKENLEEEMAALSLRFSEIYIENEKLNKDKKQGITDVEMAVEQARAEITHEVTTLANAQVAEIRQNLQQQVNSHVKEIERALEIEKKKEVDSRAEKIKQRLQRDADSLKNDMERAKTEEVNSWVETIKTKMLSEYTTRLNNYRKDAHIKMFCLGFLALVFFLDAHYHDLKSFFVQA